MPYVDVITRRKLFDLREELALILQSPGELNYLVTNLINTYLASKGESYQTYNDIMGALEGAKLELYRRKIAPYEDKKIKKNGDVY